MAIERSLIERRTKVNDQDDRATESDLSKITVVCGTQNAYKRLE
jgi:hypothetical protein